MPGILTLNINASCQQAQSNPHVSKTGNNEPSEVKWTTAVACTVTFPKGYFVGYETEELVIPFDKPGSSDSFQLLSDAPSGAVNYTITNCPSGPPPFPPMITIDN